MLKWRFTSKEEIDEGEELYYINVAIENEKQGKTSKPEKKASILSEFFSKKKFLQEQKAKFDPCSQELLKIQVK